MGIIQLFKGTHLITGVSQGLNEIIQSLSTGNGITAIFNKHSVFLTHQIPFSQDSASQGSSHGGPSIRIIVSLFHVLQCVDVVPTIIILLLF